MVTSVTVYVLCKLVPINEGLIGLVALLVLCYR